MQTNSDVGTVRGVLIIYTCGIIGRVPKDENEPVSPFVPAPIAAVLDAVPAYDSRDGTIALGSHRLALGTYAFETPLDSANLDPRHWLDIGEAILQNYAHYEGFVVLHDTDTMAHTASVLAFILENLQKPVVVTSLQRSIAEARTDGVQNLIAAIEVAGARSLGGILVPEVCVFFRDTLTRGCRTTKFSASGYRGFVTPKSAPLGHLGERLVVDAAAVRPHPNDNDQLLCHTHLENNVISLVLFPGIEPNLIRRLLTSPGLRGAVLHLYGTGNCPSTPEFLAAISAAVDAGVVLVAVSQCLESEVSFGLYEASVGLLTRGVVSGLDMTPEAALAKLRVVLGAEADAQVAGDLVQLNMRGEQRTSVFSVRFPAGVLTERDRSALVRPIGPAVGSERFAADTIEDATLVMSGLTIPGKSSGSIRIRVYLGSDGVDGATLVQRHPRFVGEARTRWSCESVDTACIVPIPARVWRLMDVARPPALTLVDVGGGAAWTQCSMRVYANS